MRSESDRQIEAVRRFNRFYTRSIGVLQQGLLASPFTLTQARVLFELGSRESVGAAQLCDLLGLDAGYLSRIVQDFAAQGLLRRERCGEDARRFALSLTDKGKKAFRDLDRRSQRAVGAMLAPLSGARRERLLEAMHVVHGALAAPAAMAGERVAIRPHRIGDIGWAIEQHALVYAREYGWSGEFEALVATLFARFATRHDPASEHCWIAAVDGERAGCVFVVRNDEDAAAAQLRCLLVLPAARGLGVGRRLVDQCLAFAKAAGYARMMLWTNDVLVAARRIYEAAGFALARQERHHSFGHDLVGQIWTREL